MTTKKESQKSRSNKKYQERRTLTSLPINFFASEYTSINHKTAEQTSTRLILNSSKKHKTQNVNKNHKTKKFTILAFFYFISYPYQQFRKRTPQKLQLFLIKTRHFLHPLSPKQSRVIYYVQSNTNSIMCTKPKPHIFTKFQSYNLHAPG